MRRTGLVSSFALLGLIVACGTEGGSEFTQPPIDDQSDAGSNQPGPGSFGDSGNTTVECASQVLCGPQGVCCAVGQECVESACANACESGVRCGAGCCQTGQVCLSQQCTTPTTPCQDSFDCEENEFCEPTISKCLPQPAQAGLCEFKPPVLPLKPKLEWSWTSSSIRSTYLQVVNTPIVVDLDNDKIPDVIIVTSEGYDATGPAYLRVLDGKTGLEKWAADVEAFHDGTNGTSDNRVSPRGTPAAADLTGDGSIEIIAPKMGGGLIAFDAKGKLLWKSTRADGKTAYNGAFNSVTVAIADMDNDGSAEIVAGGIVFDHLGHLTSDTHIGHEKWGANSASYGAVSIIADVDGNDTTTEQYVVTGNRAVRKNGTQLWPVGTPTLSDGYPAIANLDNAGAPELVVITGGYVRVQNATDGTLIDQLKMPGDGLGGPPTIADFDNDGIMEIASANGTAYNVFEYDPTKPTGQKLSVKWTTPTQDGSSNVTGSSVFDFEGDGKAEVVYNDECYTRVYSGVDGTELFKEPNSSATIHEMPVLVDVDGDNNTEFVVVANDRNHGPSGLKCAGYTALGAVPRHGVFVYGDENDRWVRTRKIWNQHAYHITNIASDGKVPMVEPRSFTSEQNNDYRVSSQGKGVYNAPDLRVDLEISTASCPTSLGIRARVKNAGALGVPAGVKVRFYAGTNASGQLLTELTTTKSLLPGESQIVTYAYPLGAPGTGSPSFYVVVDGATDAVTINECPGDNNGAGANGIRCPGVN